MKTTVPFRTMFIALAAYVSVIGTELTGAKNNSRDFLIGIDSASQNPDDVRFYLFSNPSNAGQAEQIVFNSTNSLLPLSFNCATISKILVHGFTDNGLEQTGFPANVIKEYLNKYPTTSYNIISVDWGPLATCTDPSSYLCYPKAALENVQIAGGRIGEFIVWLRNICGREYLDLVHVVGHSLGSHVSGYAGYTVLTLTGSRIGRLTGLDPAGPLFLNGAPSAAPRMMRASDANFADVYHTASGSKGTPCAVGHLDFFVNGGFAPQPDCELIEDFKSFAACSHATSHVYYSNSIAFGDPAKNSSARVRACRLFPVNCLAVAPDLSSLDGSCDQTIVYGEYLKPGPFVGTYCVGYPPKRTCLSGQFIG